MRWALLPAWVCCLCRQEAPLSIRFCSNEPYFVLNLWPTYTCLSQACHGDRGGGEWVAHLHGCKATAQQHPLADCLCPQRPQLLSNVSYWLFVMPVPVLAAATVWCMGHTGWSVVCDPLCGLVLSYLNLAQLLSTFKNSILSLPPRCHAERQRGRREGGVQHHILQACSSYLGDETKMGDVDTQAHTNRACRL